jgi:hypothetical protein
MVAIIDPHKKVISIERKMFRAHQRRHRQRTMRGARRSLQRVAHSMQSPARGRLRARSSRSFEITHAGDERADGVSGDLAVRTQVEEV